jgi:hypothetical protein
MHEFADECIARSDDQRSFKSPTYWTIILGSVLVVLILILAVPAWSQRNSIAPQFVGAWTLTLADGTSQLVTFNPDGTVSANDNVVYRWTGTSTEVHIDTYEQATIDLRRPGTVVKYVFPDRGHVVLTPEYSNDGKDLTLVGEAVKLRREAASTNPG